MKRIKLTKGKFALVDDEDFEYLSQWNWYVSSHNYAITTTKKPCLYMHRIVNKTPKGILTDHINRNTLDNRKCNLRIADKRINSINKGTQSNNTSGYRGISWNKNHKKWETYIWNCGLRIQLGYYKIIKDAILVRKKAEIKYYEQILA